MPNFGLRFLGPGGEILRPVNCLVAVVLFWIDIIAVGKPSNTRYVVGLGWGETPQAERMRQCPAVRKGRDWSTQANSDDPDRKITRASLAERPCECIASHLGSVGNGEPKCHVNRPESEIRETRDAALGDLHPMTVGLLEQIAKLCELLALDPNDKIENAAAFAQGSDLKSDILYVSEE